ncbi:MAG: nitronate monooxygenase [Desulfarculaceae bacterium]|nr:nitronate monooxygenase [Desulfarculaceae bacterium]MCF8074298.1 nitronate monooxygenase [Desulfarculaceae bacterium]MCF8103366.1 nitronate monooxygenase [Desulfarculaceae bacterium]MCF8117844.1 nitronate monooxygenase [Desulfarculaceae bacterium]
MFQTRLTEMLGIKHPLQCGTMMWLSNAEFVAAAANAGVLACLASAMYPDAQALKDEIAKLRGLTDQPFGVNVSLFPGHSAVAVDQALDILAEAGVKLVETAGRSPEPHRPRIQQAGMLHLHKCARLRDALKAQKLGVDIVAVVGAECGGHPSMDQVTTMVLAPQVTAALEVPVIVGGGFCDGRTLVAGLALGADAVLMGTRFLNTEECPVHPDIKERLMAAASDQTLIVQQSIGSGVRVLDNDWARQVLALEEKGAGLEELLPYISGQRTKSSWLSGDPDAIMACGQVVGSSKSTPTIAELVGSVMEQAEATLKRLA